MVYDCCSNSWSAATAAQPVACPLLKRADQVGGNEGVASGKYFAQQVEDTRSAAALGAAAAAFAALKRGEHAVPASSALQEVQHHCRQAVAYVVDEPGGPHVLHSCQPDRLPPAASAYDCTFWSPLHMP